MNELNRIMEKCYPTENILSKAVNNANNIQLKDFTIPIRQKINMKDFTESLMNIVQRFKETERNGLPIFTLADARVAFSADTELDVPLMTNIAIALFVGKDIASRLCHIWG